MTSLQKVFPNISLNSLEAMVALRISLSLNKQRSPISSLAMRHLLILMKEKSNQFSGHASFANLNEPNVNAIIVHDGVLLEDGMRTVMS